MKIYSQQIPTWLKTTNWYFALFIHFLINHVYIKNHKHYKTIKEINFDFKPFTKPTAHIIIRNIMFVEWFKLQVTAINVFYLMF